MVVNSYEKLAGFVRILSEQGTTYKCYNKNTTWDGRLELENVNEAWKDIQVVIYTSTITVGINFDLPDVFDELFVWGSSASTCVRDVFQMTLRVRHIKSFTMYCAVWAQSMGKYPTSLKKIKEEREANMKKTLEITNESSTNPQSNHNIQIWELAPEWLKLAHDYNTLEINQSKVFYGSVFSEYLSICNYRVSHWNDVKEISTAGNPSNTSYADIPDITEEDATELEFKTRSHMASEWEKLVLEKYKFKGRLITDLPVDDQALLFFKYITGNRKDKAQFDNVAQEKQYTMQNRIEYEAAHNFLETAGVWIRRYQLIRQLNTINGIAHSCEAANLTMDNMISCGQIIAPQLDQVKRDWSIRNQRKNGEALTADQLVVKIYKSWNGSKFKKRRYRPRVNGKQVTVLTWSKEEVPLWSNLK
jgi:hypothetical protein